MNALFLLFCITGIVLWFYGLGPFLKVRKYRAENRFVPITDIYKDAQHSIHNDLIKTLRAYGGFALCWLAGMLIGFFTFPKASP